MKAVKIPPGKQQLHQTEAKLWLSFSGTAEVSEAFKYLGPDR